LEGKENDENSREGKELGMMKIHVKEKKMMKIHVTANLILTIPNPKKGESFVDIMLVAEQTINQRCQLFIMPKTKTKVGSRIHIQVGKQVK